MLLVYGTEVSDVQIDPDALSAYMEKHISYYNEMAERGILQTAERLRPTSTATTVRMQDGEVLVVDGPFAETKEQLGGINIFECKDLDEAIEVASRFPMVEMGYGCIEIRPIWEAPAEVE
jgi:hypothetical protein